MYEQKMLGRYVDDIALKMSMRVGQLIDALHELSRMTLFLFRETADTDAAVDAWLSDAGFAVDPDGFFQSLPLLEKFREGTAPLDAISYSWGKHLVSDPLARFRMYALRNMGAVLNSLHKRLPYAAWIYYQDVSNTAIQYPYIDQSTAITWDFDWHQYHTFISVNPSENPMREIRWTQPSIDYAGEGLILSVSCPLYLDAASSSFAGLWSIDVPVRRLHTDCIKTHLFDHQDTFIVDDEGQFVFHENIPFLIDKKEGSIYRETIASLGNGFASIEFRKLDETADTPFSIWNDQEELIACARRIPALNWYLFSTVPRRVFADVVSKRIEGLIENIKAGDLTRRLSFSELPLHWHSLIEAMNDLSASLEKADEREKHLIAVLRSIRSINQLIIKEKDAASLIQLACNILVETRDYRHAWIALLDASTMPTIVKEAGLGPAFAPIKTELETAKLQSHCQQALEKPDIVVTQTDDLPNAYCPIFSVFKNTAVLTVRLENAGILYGLLSITVDIGYAVDPEELELLKQLAGDLGLAIHGIALDQAQKRAAEALTQLNEELELRVRQRTAELEASNRELEDFSSSVSHDLRAPLRTVNGYATMLLEDYQDRLPEDGVHYLNRIKAGTSRMGELIDSLLQLSRIVRIPLKRDPLNLSNMAEQVVDGLREGDPTRTIAVDIAPDLFADGDPTLIKVLLQNLFDNAWKFTGKQASPRIMFGRVHTSPYPFFVRDNGCGFDMGYADKLFKAFERLHDEGDFPGNGIGLAVAERSVKRHGGRIWAECPQTGGTTFFFTLESAVMEEPTV